MWHNCNLFSVALILYDIQLFVIEVQYKGQCRIQHDTPTASHQELPLAPICLQIFIILQTKSHYNRTYNITSCMLAPFWPSNILNWQKPCKPVNLIHNMNILLNQKLVKVGWNKNTLNSGLFGWSFFNRVIKLMLYFTIESDCGQVRFQNKSLFKENFQRGSFKWLIMFTEKVRIN